MAAVIFAEVLGRRGHVEQRVRVDSFPFSIGRAYTNDLILDDPQVCPEHACLDLLDGALVLRDLGSVNGLYAMRSGDRVESVDVASATDVRLGRTVLRFRGPDYEVPAAVEYSPARPLLEWLVTHWSSVPVLMALLAGVGAWSTYRHAYTEVELLWVLRNQALSLLAFLAWAGTWALFARLLVHESRFLAHWAATCAYSLAGTLLGFIMLYARFVLASVDALQHVQYVGSALLAGLLIHVQLGLTTALRSARRAAAATVVALVAFGVFEVQWADEADWVSTLPYWSRLMPVDPSWLPSESADAFFADVGALKDELDALALEQAKAEP